MSSSQKPLGGVAHLLDRGGVPFYRALDCHHLWGTLGCLGLKLEADLSHRGYLPLHAARLP